MWEAIKKMSVKQIVLWSALLLFGLSLFIVGLFNISYVITGNATDLNEVISNGDDPKKLDVVELDVKYVLGGYAEENKTLMGIKSKPEYHFIVVLDDGSLISLSVKDETYVRKLNYLATTTQNIIYGYNVGEPTPVHITGVITGMSSKCKKLYQDALEYMGIDKDSSYVHTLEIDTTKTRGMMTAALSIGILLIIIGIVYLKSCLKEKKYKQQQFATVGANTLDPLSAMVQSRENEPAQVETSNQYTNDDSSSNYSSNNGLDTNSDASADADKDASEVKEPVTGTSKFTLKKD